MRKPAAILVATIALATVFSGCLGVGTIEGFDSTDIKTPLIEYEDLVAPNLPLPSTPAKPSAQYALSWSMTDAFEKYGGVAILEVANKGSTDMFVYGCGIRWISSGITYERDCEVYIGPGNHSSLGIIAYGAPDDPGLYQYRLILQFAVLNQDVNGWYDYGEQPGEIRTMTVKNRLSINNYTITNNDAAYYHTVQSKIDPEAVQNIVSSVKENQSGPYSILQIAAAYEWITENIDYMEDEGGDYWQTARETVDLGMGDCEDQALLMASVIVGLGGSARFNIIDRHAFTTVFVAETITELNNVRKAINSFYGLEGGLNLCWLEDEFGYWLVVDTVGFPYAGGLPTKASPCDLPGIEGWTLDSSTYLRMIDVAV